MQRGSLAATFLALLLMLQPYKVLHAAEDEYAEERMLMVRDQIRKRGITDKKVLAAMARAPRHLFVPDGSSLRHTPIAPCPSAKARPSPSPIS